MSLASIRSPPCSALNDDFTGFELVPVDRVREQVRGDVLVAVLLRVGVRLVDDAAAGDVPALEARVRHVVEVAVGVRVVQRAVLA